MLTNPKGFPLLALILEHQVCRRLFLTPPKGPFEVFDVFVYGEAFCETKGCPIEILFSTVTPNEFFFKLVFQYIQETLSIAT